MKNGHPLAKHRSRIDMPEKPREQLVTLLNSSLATALDLATQCKQAHWNVAGMEFYQLHLLFDKAAGEIGEAVDLLAERVLQLGGTALGTARIAAERSLLDEYPQQIVSGKQHVEALTERMATFANHLRQAIRTSDTLGDPTTADIYTEISRTADKTLWMLEAHLRS
ncbi:MAG: DNA starvation/stationary phase protection protein Dps [Vulcanimicrobiaceae bacterium]